MSGLSVVWVVAVYVKHLTVVPRNAPGRKRRERAAEEDDEESDV